MPTSGLLTTTRSLARLATARPEGKSLTLLPLFAGIMVRVPLLHARRLARLV
tara:strand:- start:681 stop:836 length:156 start_codon:yes stop_codon:yes gene_type:complete